MGKKREPLIIRYKDFILFLGKLNRKKRAKLIGLLKRDHIECISEIFSNFLKKRLTSDKKAISKVSPHKNLIKTVAKKKVSLSEKKKILSSPKGAGILSVLIPLATSLIAGLTS